MRLTNNFTLEELIKSSTATKLKIKNVPDSAALAKLTELCKKILQPVREKWGNPLLITSGYRCEQLNKIVGGVSTSQHLYGEAADLKVTAVDRLYLHTNTGCKIKINDERMANRLLFNLICGMIENGEITVGQLIDEKNYRWLHISLPSATRKNQILHL